MGIYTNYVDPINENRIYNLHTYVTVSNDGGKTFESLMTAYGSNGVHPDHHAFWGHPTNPQFIIEAIINILYVPIMIKNTLLGS